MTKKELLLKVGERITQLRKEQSLSQTDLAHLCDWDRQVLHKIEKGQVNTSVYVIYRIAQELKTTIKDILDVD